MRSRYHYLPFLIAAVLLLHLFCSCSAMTKVRHKDKVNEEVKSETKTDQTATTASNTALTRTITEDGKDTARFGAEEADTDAFLHDLENGGITFKQGDITITASADSSGKIHLRSKVNERKVPVNTKRTIIESLFTNSTATVVTQEDKKSDDKKKETKVDVNKDRKATVNWTIVIPILWLLLLLVVVFLIWWYLPHKPRPK